MLTAAGFDEAMTLSVVDASWLRRVQPLDRRRAAAAFDADLAAADCLRRSLVPSLLGARRTNEALANPPIELFEIANVYLPRGDDCRPRN